MTWKKIIVSQLVVALVVATGFALVNDTPTAKVIEKVVTEKLGAFPGGDILVPVSFKDGIFITGSSTLGIGTTTNARSAQSGQNNLIIDGTNATPTIAFFATSTNTGTTGVTWSSTSAGSGCIQFNSGTTSGQYFRLYVGESGTEPFTPSLDGRGLIFEAGACQ